jgi:cytochrome c oxidase subunit 4
MAAPPTTRFPRVHQREHAEHVPSQRQYVGIAVFLGVITAIEVAVYYPDIPGALKAAILVFLATIKFATVAAFFMHLRFDGRLFTFIFVTGIFLAIMVFLIVITTLRAIY